MLGHIMLLVTEQEKKEMKRKKPKIDDIYLYIAMGFLVFMSLLGMFIGVEI